MSFNPLNMITPPVPQPWKGSIRVTRESESHLKVEIFDRPDCAGPYAGWLCVPNECADAIAREVAKALAKYDLCVPDWPRDLGA